MYMDKEYKFTGNNCSSNKKTNNGNDSCAKHTEEVSINQTQIEYYDDVQKMLESKLGVRDTPIIDLYSLLSMSEFLSSVKGVKLQMDFLTAACMIATGSSEQIDNNQRPLECIYKKLDSE